jgi:DNA-binding IclR family transcriptional regulator
MRSVDRALDVLYLLGQRSAPMSAKEIAETLSLPKSTTHHLLNVMMDRRFVSYLPDRRMWALGERPVRPPTSRCCRAPMSFTWTSASPLTTPSGW